MPEAALEQLEAAEVQAEARAVDLVALEVLAAVVLAAVRVQEPQPQDSGAATTPASGAGEQQQAGDLVEEDLVGGALPGRIPWVSSSASQWHATRTRLASTS